jgi:hypothetical protein
MNYCRFPQGSAGGRSMTVSNNDDSPGFDYNIPKRFIRKIILKKFHSYIPLSGNSKKLIKDGLV